MGTAIKQFAQTVLTAGQATLLYTAPGSAGAGGTVTACTLANPNASNADTLAMIPGGITCTAVAPSSGAVWMLQDDAGAGQNLYRMLNGQINRVIASGLSAGQASGCSGLIVDATETYVYFTAVACIKRLDVVAGTISTWAGVQATTGTADGIGTAARFNTVVRKICFDPSYANIYVADSGNNLIRKVVVSSATVSTIAGTGAAGDTNANGVLAQVNNPISVVVDSTNTNLYFSTNATIRQYVIASTAVSTLAGNGTSGWIDGTGAAARLTTLIWDLAITPDGLSLLALEGNKIKRMLISSAAVTTVAGGANNTTGPNTGSGPGARFTAAQSMTPCVAGSNLFYIVNYAGFGTNSALQVFDCETNMVRLLFSGSTITGTTFTIGDSPLFTGDAFVSFHVTLANGLRSYSTQVPRVTVPADGGAEWRCNLAVTTGGKFWAVTLWPNIGINVSGIEIT